MAPQVFSFPPKSLITLRWTDPPAKTVYALIPAAAPSLYRPHPEKRDKREHCENENTPKGPFQAIVCTIENRICASSMSALPSSKGVLAASFMRPTAHCGVGPAALGPQGKGRVHADIGKALATCGFSIGGRGRQPGRRRAEWHEAGKYGEDQPRGGEGRNAT